MPTMTKDTAQNLIAQFGASAQDSGNPKVQVALMTHSIDSITEHMTVHMKDKNTRRGLTTMVACSSILLSMDRLFA